MSPRLPDEWTFPLLPGNSCAVPPSTPAYTGLPDDYPLVRRGLGATAGALAGAQDRADTGPGTTPDRAARRPAEVLPGDPPDRDQRQDLDGADGRRAAARGGAAHRTLHQPAPGDGAGADHPGRRAGQRAAFRRRVRRARALPGAGRLRARRPADLLR